MMNQSNQIRMTTIPLCYKNKWHRFNAILIRIERCNVTQPIPSPKFFSHNMFTKKLTKTVACEIINDVWKEGSFFFPASYTYIYTNNIKLSLTRQFVIEMASSRNSVVILLFLGCCCFASSKNLRMYRLFSCLIQLFSFFFVFFVYFFI